MNKTTSFDFTSFSMNFSMLILCSLAGRVALTLGAISSPFYSMLVYMYSKPLDIQSKMASELACMRTVISERTIAAGH